MASTPGTNGGDRKPANRDYCFRHALMYEGYECPRCADAGPQQDQPAEFTPGGSPAMAAAGVAGVTTVSPEARSNSLRKSAEALQLLNAGAGAEALTLIDQAVELDPRNLQAHIVGARAAGRAGESGRQEDFVKDGARLLSDPQYRLVVQWYLELLAAAPDSFAARPVVNAFVATKTWGPVELAAMIRTLALRGLNGEALRVIESVPVGRRSLALWAYSVQLTRRALVTSDVEVDAYLSAIPASERNRPLAEFRQVREEGGFALTTLVLIRDALRTRYGQWRPEIATLLEEAAREEAVERIRPEIARDALRFAARLTAVTFGAVVVVTLAAGGAAPIFLGGLTLTAIVAVAAFLYAQQSAIARRLPAMLPQLIESQREAEHDRWAVVLDDELEAPEAAAPTPPAEPIRTSGTTCPRCGARVAQGLSMCSKCGHELAPPPSDPQTA